MYKSIKRLWKDRRGNALVIVGAAMPLVVGAAGLATDTIQWVTYKRELQRAADSAAFAGVIGKAWGASTADAAVNADLAKNTTTGINITGLTPTIGYPTSASYSSAVRVTLSVQKSLGFSSYIMHSAPTITATATAALIDDGWYCVVALENGSDPGITIGGSSSATLGCGAISDSISDTKSVDTSGSTYNFNATVVAGSGGMPSTINGTSTVQSYHLPQPDPFANLYPTDIPNGTPCKSSNQNRYGPQNRKLKAGCYTDFKITGNGTYTMDPGIYYLNNADFDIAGGVTIVGDGVTIILTGTNPGSIKTNGNAGIQLTATHDGGTYDKMLFIQNSLATVDNLNEINGTSTSHYDGAMYFPKGKVTFTGTSGAMTHCAMVVSKKVDFSGNANLQNDVTDCPLYKKVPGKVLRLVA